MARLSTEYNILYNGHAMNYTLNISTCCEVECEFDEEVIFIQQHGETTSIHRSAALGYTKYDSCRLFGPFLLESAIFRFL